MTSVDRRAPLQRGSAPHHAHTSANRRDGPAELKTLDGARQRLSQLSNALNSLKNELAFRDALPPWQTLQDALALINHQIQSTSLYLASDAAAGALASARAFPLPSFPDLAHRAVVEQLLRKKPEPAVEDWIASGAAAGVESGDVRALRGLWDWAIETALDASGEVPWGIDYTIAEREEGIEGVVTGLKRELDDGMEEASGSEDEDEEGEDEDAIKVDGVAPASAGAATAAAATPPPPRPPPLEDLLRYVNSGSAAPTLSGAAALRR